MWLLNTAQNVSDKIGNKIEKRKGNSLGHGSVQKIYTCFLKELQHLIICKIQIASHTIHEEKVLRCLGHGVQP